MDESLRGQLPRTRKQKADLLRTHKAHVKKQERNPDTSRPVKQPILSQAYPASTRSIRDLDIIPLSELRIETHHRGKGIIVRAISPPYTGAASVSVVEDKDGNVDKLAIYNHSDSSVLSNLPDGCVVAVKEPYYKFNGGVDDYMICVDHPCDVLLLRLSDPIIPEALRQRVNQVMLKTTKEWATAGDQAFLQHDLPTAIFCYAEALDAATPSDEQGVRLGILAKRAGSNLVLGKYDAAKEDALASCTGAASDWKAYFTAGRAAYGLCDFKTSRQYLEHALELNRDDPNVRRDYERCLSRLDEEKHGDFDFHKMYASLGPKSVHLDNASFMAQTVVADSPLHGRGLFAKAPIKAGHVIFCEKAILMPNQYEPVRASAALYAMMVRQLYDNPSLAEQVLQLHGGDFVRSGAEGKIVDGMPVVDVWLVESIRLKNCFSSPLSTRDETKPTSRQGQTTKGLWPYASCMNHSCVPNSCRSFLGDVLITRATRDIAEGEEVTQQYIPVKAHVGRRQAEYAQGWGFECTCALCRGEGVSDQAQIETRTQLLAQIEKFANKNPPNKGVVPDAAIRKMEKMTKQLEEAHEAAVYDKLPRLMLVYPTMWLLEAYRGHKNHAKVIASAMRVLRNFGYVVQNDAPHTVFECSPEIPSLMTIHVVTSLRCAADAYRAMDQSEMARRCEKAAKFGYVIITGFEDDLSVLDP